MAQSASDSASFGGSWQQREQTIKPLGVVLQPPAVSGDRKVFPTVYVPDRLLVLWDRSVDEVVGLLAANFAGFDFARFRDR